MVARLTCGIGPERGVGGQGFTVPDGRGYNEGSSFLEVGQWRSWERA